MMWIFPWQRWNFLLLPKKVILKNDEWSWEDAWMQASRISISTWERVIIQRWIRQLILMSNGLKVQNHDLMLTMGCVSWKIWRTNGNNDDVSFSFAPRDVHLDCLKRMYSYIRKFPSAPIWDRIDTPDFSDQELNCHIIYIGASQCPSKASGK
jgi:hypothetical protein